MLRVVVIISLLMSLAACTSTPDWKAIYGEKTEEKDLSNLEVPPDLSEPNITDSLALPNVVASGSTYLDYKKVDQSGVKVLPANPHNVKIIRSGSHQWLEVKSSPDKLWAELKVFFNKVGFNVKREEKRLGFMETDWVETKAYVPDSWTSKLLNLVVATNLKDKYRVHLEKTGKPNITRLFFTHQGQKQGASGTDFESSVAFVKYWITRDSDPELEAEMYQRFLVFRDSSITDAKKIAAHIEAKEKTIITEQDGAKVLHVGEGFARTWRRVGIALDRIGLLIEDRNRSGGLYYLRITDDFRAKIKEEESWLANLFSNNDIDIKDRYLLNVKDERDKTTISLLEATGAKPDQRLVTQFLIDLKSYLN